MDEKQGYFSLIQYSEYPERNEFLNVGIVLFSNAIPHVIVKLGESRSRIRKVFGVYPGKHFEILMHSMKDRIMSEFNSNWDRQSVEKFIGLRSGNIRLSSPKSVLVDADPNIVANELFERLVEPFEIREPIQRVQKKLKKQLVMSGVESLLEKPKPVSLPQGVVVKAQYAYQNGSYNLINAISLRDDPNIALAAAGKQAIEGLWLSEFDKGQKRLIVVGDVENQNSNFVNAVKDLMRMNKTEFYSLSDISPLAREIREHVTANDLSQSTSSSFLN
ncbi:DUF3037 domain-containing protein [Rhizobium sp. L1K21]|uniref:DUF3037 domain-containing protein n=1 Tax=Rhizobium sp. L1K21 TaxID=2954933 RepID=UPI0020929715|nr:DUF3037 domain-containing protein [Rhizobium sp. L1K21]MCO6184819.1 DUF3037 domain-containing protein [Rhizobium sp. L1K21]